MDTATISTKGQLVIPSRLRRALALQPGDKVTLRLEGGSVVIQRQASAKARLLKRSGRTVLVAPPGAPPMTAAYIKSLLSEFP